MTKKRDQRRVGVGHIAGSLVAGSVGEGLARAPANHAALAGLNRHSEQSGRISRKEMAALKRDIGARGVSVRKAVVDNRAFSWFDVDGRPSRAVTRQRPGRSVRDGLRRRFGEVVVGKRETALVAHELGHASRKSKNMSLLRPGYLRAVIRSRFFGPAGGVVSGAISGSRAKKDETIGRTALKGTAMGAVGGVVGSSPSLFEEARATTRGLKSLKRIGIPKARRVAAMKALGAAYLSHLSRPVIGGMAIGGTVALVARKLRGRSKTSGFVLAALSG